MKYRVVLNGLGEYSVQEFKWCWWRLVGHYNDWHGRFEYIVFASKEGAETWIIAQSISAEDETKRHKWKVV